MYSDEFISHQQQLEDLTGKRFGRLVVKNLFKADKHTKWLCTCDCGKEIITRSDTLKSGKAMSCGCYHKEILKKGKSNEEIQVRYIFNSYRGNAKKRNIYFGLTIDLFQSLINSNCYYCARPPSNIRYHLTDRTNNYMYNGIDRLDNSKGYTEENCVPCCCICNRAKGVLSVDEFRQWIITVYKNFGE